MNLRRAILVVGCVVSVLAALPAWAEKRAVVSRIDHFVVEDPRAEELFNLFANQFQLPTIWPMASYGSFRSGGLYFGNVVIEVGHAGDALKVGDPGDTAKGEETGDAAQARDTGDAAKGEETGDAAQARDTGDTAKGEETGDAAQARDTGDAASTGGHGDRLDPGHAQFTGIVFAPLESASASVAELDARRIAHGQLDPFWSKPQGQEPAQALWTVVRVHDVGPEGIGVVICDYHFDTQTGLTAAAAELRRLRGGPLGLVGVREVVIESSQWNDARARWRHLLAPAVEGRAGAFGFSSGPAIQLVRGNREGIRSITLEVISLIHVRAFLAKQGIDYKDHGSELVMGPRLHGLSLSIVQPSPG